MEGTVLIPTYEYLGTLAEEPKLSVRIVRRTDSDRLMVVNCITESRELRPLFRDLYASYSRRWERSEFLELFSVNQKFFAAFQYHQGPTFAELYTGCPGDTKRRLKILTSALLKVYKNAGDLPEAVICSVLQPENLLLDDNGGVHLLYRFRQEFMPEDAGCSMWTQAAGLVAFMLDRELRDPHQKIIRNVHKKCVAGLYSSLPALINDLKKVSESLGQTGLFHAVKTFVLQEKTKIAQISWLGMVTLFTFLIIYLINGLLGREALEAAKLSDIGTITYVAAQDEEGNSLQLTDPDLPQPGDDLSFSALPDKDAPLESEDYIVQPGDTLESVCSAYYGSGAYAELVAGFNGLDPRLKPDAGSVLRLPLRDQLAQYLGN